MTTPDEIFVNPRIPDDVEFGHSIVVSLTGSPDYTGSYIKTDRTGEMTHYIANERIREYPIRDYKCYPSRFLESGKEINYVPVLSAYNTDDTFAVDMNNIESYGDHLYSTKTLFNLPAENPPSATLASAQYCELQFDLPDQTPEYFAIMINNALGLPSFNLAISDGAGWSPVTAAPTVYGGPGDYETNMALTSSIETYQWDIDGSSFPSCTAIRLRINNIETTAKTIKLHHVMIAGVKN